MASGQVGVASNCPANLDPIQSKIAQGAKQGESDEVLGSEVRASVA